MSENKVKVYFLGSGDISIPIMEALRNAPGLELMGVASQRKESKGPGPVRTIKSPLVKHCEKCGIPIERYPSVNKEEFHNVLRERGVELLVVASYGQILKPELLALPKYGCLNVHASLLPKYRGASPIVASLLNGDRVTGVSFMQMEAGLDTGPIYRMCELEILPDDNADTLEERLGKLAGESIEEVILEIVRQGLKPVPQCSEGSSYAKKICKEDGKLCWGKSAEEICNMLRAYTPWPCVSTTFPTTDGKGATVKITRAEVLPDDQVAAPGTILETKTVTELDENDKPVKIKGIVIKCGTGRLFLKKILPNGRKEMDAWAYFPGMRIPQELVIGTKLE
ncbi:MAG: methionyl-tRNA formyltransferase [Victivallales bacterium]|nr:methionyl-tRNA formyltransferase [Victivallales bacterium]